MLSCRIAIKGVSYPKYDCIIYSHIAAYIAYKVYMLFRQTNLQAESIEFIFELEKLPLAYKCKYFILTAQ